MGELHSSIWGADRDRRITKLMTKFESLVVTYAASYIHLVEEDNWTVLIGLPGRIRKQSGTMVSKITKIGDTLCGSVYKCQLSPEGIAIVKLISRTIPSEELITWYNSIYKNRNVY